MCGLLSFICWTSVLTWSDVSSCCFSPLGLPLDWCFPKPFYLLQAPLFSCLPQSTSSNSCLEYQVFREDLVQRSLPRDLFLLFRNGPYWSPSSQPLLLTLYFSAFITNVTYNSLKCCCLPLRRSLDHSPHGIGLRALQTLKTHVLTLQTIRLHRGKNSKDI